MYLIDNSTAAATQPASTLPGTPGWFTDGNPAGGIPATIVPAEWLNSVQAELINVVEAAGLTPTKNLFTQLLQAIQKLASGRLIGVQVFANAGAFTYTPSAGATHGIVDVVGAGAGGGYAAASNVGSGGGGGGFARAFLSALASEPVVVGAGGTGGTSSAAATNGGTSSFGGSIQSTGGTAGATNSNAGGAPGVGSGGSINLSGSNGAGGILLGGSVGLYMGGFGGTTPGYSTTSGYVQSGQGVSAAAPGGAGGGGASGGNGGSGYKGMVVVWEYA